MDQPFDIDFVPLRKEKLRAQALNPTDWKSFFDSPSCVKEQRRALKSGDFMQCTSKAPMIYSAEHKFAYLKTPKVASTAFFKYFKDKFDDAVEVSALAASLPADTFVFTFVRNPFIHKLAGYAEIDLKQELATEGERTTAETEFQHLNRSQHRGQDRFLEFLGDIEHHRFHESDAWAPLHARAQVGAILCTHQVSFIGHLEHLERDWAAVQELAQIPLALRTDAVPAFHASEKTSQAIYRADEDVPLSADIKTKICELFPSDFFCFGYDMPSPCVMAGLVPGE